MWKSWASAIIAIGAHRRTSVVSSSMGVEWAGQDRLGPGRPACSSESSSRPTGSNQPVGPVGEGYPACTGPTIRAVGERTVGITPPRPCPLCVIPFDLVQPHPSVDRLARGSGGIAEQLRFRSDPGLGGIGRTPTPEMRFGLHTRGGVIPVSGGATGLRHARLPGAGLSGVGHPATRPTAPAARSVGSSPHRRSAGWLCDGCCCCWCFG